MKFLIGMFLLVMVNGAFAVCATPTGCTDQTDCNNIPPVGTHGLVNGICTAINSSQKVEMPDCAAVNGAKTKENTPATTPTDTTGVNTIQQ